jgi:hypothetical protein
VLTSWIAATKSAPLPEALTIGRVPVEQGGSPLRRGTGTDIAWWVGIALAVLTVALWIRRRRARSFDVEPVSETWIAQHRTQRMDASD